MRRVAGALATAANGVLDLLDARQRAEAELPFGPARRRWTYRPQPHAGLDYGELSRPQRTAVHRLLAATLAPHAYAQAVTIMAWEDVLDNVEGGHRGRHHTDYRLCVFGAPGAEPWGWRFEGHHLSLNLTVAGDRVAFTPLFFGANPATVRHAGSVVAQPLAREESLARALLASMGPADRALAVVADAAPADIRTRDAERVGAAVEPLGVPAGRLSAEGAALLRALLAGYLDRLRPEVAAGAIRAAAAGEVHFAWEGPTAVGADHYYRIHAANLLIEYDNTGNHAHSVLRQPATDFGADLLAEHHRGEPVPRRPATDFGADPLAEHLRSERA